jgi:hypothetical protein
VKVTVITDQNGVVLGTSRHQDPQEGEPVSRLMAGPGQEAHEIELPSDLEEVESPETLHSALQDHLAFHYSKE